MTNNYKPPLSCFSHENGDGEMITFYIIIYELVTCESPSKIKMITHKYWPGF